MESGYMGNISQHGPWGVPVFAETSEVGKAPVGHARALRGRLMKGVVRSSNLVAVVPLLCCLGLITSGVRTGHHQRGDSQLLSVLDVGSKTLDLENLVLTCRGDCLLLYPTCVALAEDNQKFEGLPVAVGICNGRMPIELSSLSTKSMTHGDHDPHERLKTVRQKLGNAKGCNPKLIVHVVP